MSDKTVAANNTCFLVPNGTRLVIERDGFKYSGRLVIPDRAKMRPTTGTVVAVPESGELDAWLGKRVLFNQYAGTDVVFRGSPHWTVLQIEEIVAEITNDAILDDKELAPLNG